MRHELTPAGDAPLAPARAQRLADAFRRSLSKATRAAYSADLEDFRAWAGEPSVDALAARLLGHGLGAANELVLDYRTWLLERGLAPATVNRRLTSIRSLVSMANTLGLVTWQVAIKGVKREAYRDTRGPGRRGFQALMGELAERDTPKAARDRAMLRLLYDLALRREEVVQLDRKHLELEARVVRVKGKGRGGREPLTIPDPTAAALEAWLDVRGDGDGPLFPNMSRDPRKAGRRLTGRSLHRIVRALGADAGIEARPHGLRHAAITEALDLTGGDVRSVQRFSRHRSVQVLVHYDDRRTDEGGRIADLVARRAG